MNDSQGPHAYMRGLVKASPHLTSLSFETETTLRKKLGTYGCAASLTKFNRMSRELAKTHWLDAACVGKSTPEKLLVTHVAPLLITATGHGNRQMCLPDKYGFPRTSAKGAKKVKGFQTGDMVKAIVTKGKKAGTYVGRVAVRSTGSFNIKTRQETIQGVGYQYCHMLHQSDGYSYTQGGVLPPHA